jgi:hypothetical protein
MAIEGTPTFGVSKRQRAPLYMVDMLQDEEVTVRATLKGKFPEDKPEGEDPTESFLGLDAPRKVTVTVPRGAFAYPNQEAEGITVTQDAVHDFLSITHKGDENYVYTLERTEAPLPADAAVTASVESIGLGHADYGQIQPVSFGNDTQGQPVEVRPQAIAGASESTTITDVIVVDTPPWWSYNTKADIPVVFKVYGAQNSLDWGAPHCQDQKVA